MTKANKLLGAVAILGAVFFLMGAGSSPSIPLDEARALVEKQGALLLDVRTADEFASGHLKGATNIPVQELEAKLSSLPAKKDQSIVVHCKSGRRSAAAAQLLQKAGYTRVFDIGPMPDWK